MADLGETPQQLGADMASLEELGYRATIGLEVHCQLATTSKLFSGAANAFGEAPNTAVGEVDAGLPGALPSLNRQAVQLALRACVALDCDISNASTFDRKHYFYPDLPKGYQITQHETPLGRNGELELEPEDAPGDTTVRRRPIGIERLHLEEDAGKSTRADGDDAASRTRLVDLNRSGVPLIEIVSRPEMQTPAEAVAYLKELRRTVVQLGISDGAMAEGSMRCDANVSIRRLSAFGSPATGPRVELKNINSFKFVKDGLIHEIGRQVRKMESGVSIPEETRGYDAGRGETYSMRRKETDADYRYMADPDLPTLQVTEDRIEAVTRQMPEPPASRRARFRDEYGIGDYLAAVLCQQCAVAEYAEQCFEACVAASATRESVANWIVQDVMRVVDLPEGAEGEAVVRAVMPADDLVALLSMRESAEISDNAAREVFEAIVAEPAGEKSSPNAVVDERDLRQISDREALADVVETVLAKNPEQATQLRDGDANIVGWFIGQVMQHTGGSADPQIVRELIEDEMP